MDGSRRAELERFAEYKQDEYEEEEARTEHLLAEHNAVPPLMQREPFGGYHPRTPRNRDAQTPLTLAYDRTLRVPKANKGKPFAFFKGQVLDTPFVVMDQDASEEKKDDDHDDVGGMGSEDVGKDMDSK